MYKRQIFILVRLFQKIRNKKNKELLVKLYNQKNRYQLKADLSAEEFSRITCSFYRYVKIDDPNIFRDELYKEWVELNILGRVYIAEEGINAQISIPEPVFDTFISVMFFRPLIYLTVKPKLAGNLKPRPTIRLKSLSRNCDLMEFFNSSRALVIMPN